MAIAVAVTAINDSRVSDDEQIAVTVTDFLKKCGYRADSYPFPATGSAATGSIEDLAGAPGAAKGLMWLIRLLWKLRHERLRRRLQSELPIVTVLLHVPEECGRYDAPAGNIFAGMLALLPGLFEELQKERPYRQYIIEVSAPVSYELRQRHALVEERDAVPAKLLKLVEKSTDSRVEPSRVLRFEGEYYRKLKAD